MNTAVKRILASGLAALLVIGSMTFMPGVGITAYAAVGASANGADVTLGWSEEDFSPNIFDDVEGHTAWARESPGAVGWQYLDADGGTIYTNWNTKGITGINSFFVYNYPDQPNTAEFDCPPHSGDQYFAAMTNQPGTINNDWIISPALNFSDDFPFSFWGKSFTATWGLEQIRVLYSTTGSDEADFIALHTDLTLSVPASWTEFSYTVPHTAKYVAVNYVSNDVFMLVLDDLSIGYGSIIEYNIYRDGVKIGTTADTSYVDYGLADGDYEYEVEAVYASRTEKSDPVWVSVGTPPVGNVVATPTATPAGGAVAAGTRVSLGCSEPGATIHYTTNGDTPTRASDVYAAPITVNAAMTIKAIAVKSGMTISTVMIESYTIDAGAQVDKTALNAVIVTAEAKNEADYTAASWGPFASALTSAKAVAADTSATQVQVDDAKNALQSAMKSLVLVSTYTPGGDSSSGGGGSSNTGIDYTATGYVPSPVTVAQAAEAAKSAAAAAKTAGAATVTVRLLNPSTVDTAALDAIVTATDGLIATVHADSTSPDGKAVEARIRFSPATMSAAMKSGNVNSLNLSASTSNAQAKQVRSWFEQWFKNEMQVVSLGQKGRFAAPVEIAVKLDSNLDKDNLYFYSYDSVSNTYTRIKNPNYWVDANGYVYFTTELAGDIIISEGPLERK